MKISDDIFWGERLQLAREFRGLTLKKLGAEVSASESLLSLCENGKKKDPAPDLVQACGAVLGFEPSFFYGTLRDVFREDECSFRHRRSTPEKTKSQIRAHGTLIGMVIEKLRSHLTFPELDIPKYPAMNEEEIELAAEQTRIHWNLGIDRPVLQVGRILERAGVIIVPHVVTTTKVDAFSRNGLTTVIFLNQGIQSTSRWNFDIGHECGHLVMHQGIPTGSVETEFSADRFASAFLMPRKAFSRDFAIMGAFSWKYIFELKRRWQTSLQAIVRRAYDLGILGAVGYRRAFKYISMKGWTKSEPAEPSFQQPELLRNALQALGKEDAPLTLPELCSHLRFKPDTFKDVTGFAVPSVLPKPASVLEFPSS